MPEHWSASYLGFECSVKARLGWKGLKAEEYVDDGYVFLATPNIKDSEIDFSNVNRITKERYDESPEIMLEKGDVLVTKDGSTTGTTNIIKMLPEPATVNSSIAVLRSNGNIISEYLYYFFVSEYTQNLINRMRGGMGVPHLFQADLRKFDILIPAKQEQKVIANFLDHETAKIDTLIEKQKQLIHLLKEKRQAVISRAVTKGLIPNIEMRDSGVEWIGEVPKHWKVSKFGYVSMVVRGGSPRPAGDPALFNGDYSPWVTVAEITKDDEVYLTQTETFLTRKGSEQCRVFSSGTLLISNSGATLGVPKILSIDANANDGVVGFENLKLDREFCYFYLSVLTEDLRERIKQGSGQPNLNTDIVKNVAIPIPPENEVTEIVALIRNTRNQYANLMARASAGIELLQERRTALISAAVTGKIDVRNWVAPEEAQTNKEVAA
ncbi:restriction endonuclease subunit S [Pseudomonas sp. Y24-6]|uniref:restriction endonuclease subunit S n=1 Tax=Pseudomonas sp. Y24-6 TaxID=2750013 RepID=UPI001CE17D55|nr:restriction endonuclease subunit S [Pseudomonas sp. Y24-6]